MCDTKKDCNDRSDEIACAPYRFQGHSDTWRIQPPSVVHFNFSTWPHDLEYQDVNQPILETHFECEGNSYYDSCIELYTYLTFRDESYYCIAVERVTQLLYVLLCFVFS